MGSERGGRTDHHEKTVLLHNLWVGVHSGRKTGKKDWILPELSGTALENS